MDYIQRCDKRTNHPAVCRKLVEDNIKQLINRQLRAVEADLDGVVTDIDFRCWTEIDPWGSVTKVEILLVSINWRDNP